MAKTTTRGEDKSPDLTQKERLALGQTLQLFRKRRGLLQKQLAARSGLGVGQLSRIESGQQVPLLGSVWRACEVLELEPWRFFYAVGQYEDFGLGPWVESPLAGRPPVIRRALERLLETFLRVSGLGFAELQQVSRSLALRETGEPGCDVAALEEAEAARLCERLTGDVWALYVAVVRERDRG